MIPMKKPLLFFTLLAMLYCSPTAGGQQIKADVRYLPMLETMQSEAGVTSSFANGVAVGLGACYYYGHRIGFDVAADYMCVLAGSDNGDSYRQHAIVAPLQVNYSFMRLGYSGPMVFIYGGTTLEYGPVSSVSNANGDSVDLYAAEAGQNRFNAYLGAGIGISYRRMFALKAGYETSLLNVCRGPETTFASRKVLTLGLSITLAPFRKY